MQHIEVSDQIMEKAANIEFHRKRLNRCLELRVCPKCGEELLVGQMDGVDGHRYRCTVCRFALDI